MTTINQRAALLSTHTINPNRVKKLIFPETSRRAMRSTQHPAQ